MGVITIMIERKPERPLLCFAFQGRKAEEIAAQQNKKLSAAVLKDESQRCESFLGVSAYGG